MSSIRVFRTFLEVARTGSFAAASERAALTPAAVSLQMKTLEQDLGYTVFDRAGNVIALNARGHDLLDKARQLVACYESMVNNPANEGEPVGSITVGAIASCMPFLAGAVLELRKVHPCLKINPSISYAGDLSERVRQGELDAAVSVKNAHKCPAGVQWTPLFREPLVLITSVSARSNDLHKLIRENLFFRITRSTHTGSLVERCMKRNGLQIAEYLELNTLRTIVDMVQQDIGVSVLPLSRNATWQTDRRVRVIPLEDSEAFRSIGLFEREDRSHLTSHVRRNLLRRVKLGEG
ncbi:LysR family transcriptional regulator [Achromobacter sp. GG226]|uniref:LysR substrate-binding domain-containing protein n=1 Tax=Verticiella alkaliphila TaxID=2779529 RepID=UPI001C0ADEE0|nr:LysR substrate-binding domain-containing protein [Verticiella sp. GG226]MBU4609792.1 LysR family transcriptional regulator [Verticiella sp. GG226]